ncbi:MAG: type III pantothenate kinase [Aquificota bacterium]|nr:MAG: type III pantothenate kinase [Aquificota bacterium]
MELLTFDVGNTSVDLCLWEGSKPKLCIKASHEDIPVLKCDKVLVSSVKPSFNSRIVELYPDAFFIKHEHVPIKVWSYDKEKVGIDRLLNCYGALRLYGDNLVVVSAGTALVVDLCVDGGFVGGFVVLGLGSSLECLHRKAELIPHMELKKVDVVIGTDTQSALLGGLFTQARAFLVECKRRWEEHFGKRLRFVLTGGDGSFFEDLGEYDPLLIHRAMFFLFEAFGNNL